jgi:hypothetical protein
MARCWVFRAPPLKQNPGDATEHTTSDRADHHNTHLPSCMNRFSMQHTMSKFFILHLDATSIWPQYFCRNFFRTVNRNLGSGQNGLESGMAHLPLFLSVPLPCLAPSYPSPSLPNLTPLTRPSILSPFSLHIASQLSLFFPLTFARNCVIVDSLFMFDCITKVEI